MAKQELYHPKFYEDLRLLLSIFKKNNFDVFLLQLNKAIEKTMNNPYKYPLLKYTPLENFRKKKFFSSNKPNSYDRPNMRLLYQFDNDQDIFKFLSVGFRIPQKPFHADDIYQRSKMRDLIFFEN